MPRARRQPLLARPAPALSRRPSPPPRPRRPPPQAKAVDSQLIISASNAAMLGLGRLIVLPYQRAQVAKAGLPEQNGATHAAAGDLRAQEASFLLASNDPAGFNLIDVMAWGSLGHALGFALCALNLDAIPK